MSQPSRDFSNSSLAAARFEGEGGSKRTLTIRDDIHGGVGTRIMMAADGDLNEPVYFFIGSCLSPCAATDVCLAISSQMDGLFALSVDDDVTKHFGKSVNKKNKVIHFRHYVVSGLVEEEKGNFEPWLSYILTGAEAMSHGKRSGSIFRSVRLESLEDAN